MDDTNTMNNEQQQPTTPTPEASGDQGEKLFTQDDVNRIVSERLAREKAKAEPSAIDELETKLKARESLYDCRDYLDSLVNDGRAWGKNGMGVTALLDVLDTTDAGKFKATVEKLLEMGAFNPQHTPLKLPRVDYRGGHTDLIAEAFKRKT